MNTAEFQTKAAEFRRAATSANVQHAQNLEIFIQACSRYDWETAATAQEQAALSFDTYLLAVYNQYKLSQELGAGARGRGGWGVRALLP